MEERSVWARIGVTLTGSKEEIEALFTDNFGEVLEKLIKDGKFKLDGDSYIPETCIAEYDERYGTNHISENCGMI